MTEDKPYIDFENLAAPSEGFVVTLFLTAFSIGIAAGSMLCNRLLRGALSLRTVPWGALGIALFSIDLWLASPSPTAAEGIASFAAFLREQERVKHVYYPGFGAIVSFEIDGDAVEFARALKLWTLAESLGSVKSLFCHPATMTHASMDPEVRRSVGIGDGLLRLSVGLEDVRDLVEDLEQALVGRSVACAR